jgi:hypothetical protein
LNFKQGDAVPTLTQNVRDISGVADNDVWIFFSEAIRVSILGPRLITTRQVRVTPVGGIVSVNLEPGPAVVSFAGRVYGFTVPEIDSQIWPLISDEPLEPGEGSGSISLTDSGTGLFILGLGAGVTLTDDGTGLFTISAGGSATLTDDGTGLFSIGP